MPVIKLNDFREKMLIATSMNVSKKCSLLRGIVNKKCNSKKIGCGWAKCPLELSHKNLKHIFLENFFPVEI